MLGTGILDQIILSKYNKSLTTQSVGGQKGSSRSTYYLGLAQVITFCEYWEVS